MNTTIDSTQVCGNCEHFRGQKTPKTGRFKKGSAGECAAVLVLGAVPIAYKVEITKRWVWPQTDATKCPCHKQ